MVLEEDELMTSLAKYSSTIDFITFQNFVLFDNHLQDPTFTGLTPKSWKQSMAIVASTDLYISICIKDGGLDYGHWISDDLAGINDFWTSNGVAV